jgi:hypothetical protein
VKRVAAWHWKWRTCLRALPLAFLATACQPDDAQRFQLRVVDGRCEVMALNGAAEARLEAHAHKPEAVFQVAMHGSQTPLFGRYEIKPSRWLFHPTAPLVAGQKYTLRMGDMVYLHEEPSVIVSAPKLVRAMPETGVVPANHLKFYLRFDQPMTQGDVWKHITLHEEPSGAEVSGAFREVELWDPQGEVLTIWLHPGRQKTGVNLNEDEGAVLHEGHEYSLRVDREWTSLQGKPLEQKWEHRFRAGPPDHQQPDPKKWRVTLKPSGELNVSFDELMDFSAAAKNTQDRLWLSDSTGQVLPITLQADNHGATARFDLAHYPSGKTLLLNVNSDLEDLAGNSIARPFEQAADQAPKPTSRVIQVAVVPVGAAGG